MFYCAHPAQHKEAASAGGQPGALYGHSHMASFNHLQEAGAGEARRVHKAATGGGRYPRLMHYTLFSPWGTTCGQGKTAFVQRWTSRIGTPSTLQPAYLQHFYYLSLDATHSAALPGQPCPSPVHPSGFLLSATAKPPPPILYVFGLGYNCDSQCGPRASTILLQGTISFTSPDHTPKCTPTPNPSPKACCHL